MNAEMKKQLEKTLQGFLEKNQVLKLDIQVGSEGFVILNLCVHLLNFDWGKGWLEVTS